MRCPLEIALKSSRLLEFMIAAIHLIAAIALVQALANPLALAVSILALAVSVVVSVHRQRRKSARVLVLGREGSLEIRSASGLVCARLLPGSVDFGWALWMQWRVNVADGDCARGRVEAMMLLPDGVSGRDWRHLRTWLRHEAGERFSGDRV